MVYVKYRFFTAYNIYCQQCYICIHTVCLHMFSIVHLGVSRIPSKIRGSREKDDFLVDLRIPYFQTQFCFPWPYGTSSCPPLMWICCWSWISTVHQSVMFFMYMQRSTDLEAYISSCKFWSCLFTFCNANTFFFFFLSVSAQTPPKTSQTFSYPILVMWQIQIVNASQLGDVIFFPPISGEDFPRNDLELSLRGLVDLVASASFEEPLAVAGEAHAWLKSHRSFRRWTWHGNCRECYDSCIYCIFLCVHCI